MGGNGGGGGGGSRGGNRTSSSSTRPVHVPNPPSEEGPTMSTPRSGSGAGDGGGGGGGFSGGEAGGGGGNDSCLIQPFMTTVSSPIPSAISKTVEGQELTIVARGDNVCVLNALGELCGVILNNAAKLLKCLQQRRRFVAEVLSKDGGALQVRVRNA